MCTHVRVFVLAHEHVLLVLVLVLVTVCGLETWTGMVISCFSQSTNTIVVAMGIRKSPFPPNAKMVFKA